MSGHGHPEHDTRRRFWIALALAVPVVCSEVASAAGLLRDSLGWLEVTWLQLLLATPVVLWCGAPLLQGCCRSIAARRPGPEALAGIGVVLAFGVSAAATIAPAWLHIAARHGHPPVLLYGSAATIVVGVLAIQWLGSRAALPERQWQHAVMPLQAFAERASSWLVLAVMVTAVCAAIGGWLSGTGPKSLHAAVAAVSTLIAASPFALVLATPASVAAGVARGACAGVSFPSAAILERLADVDTVVFDRTGALAAGRPELVSVIPVDGIAESELLRLAASLEQASTHPIAVAIVAAAQARALKLGRSAGCQAVPGKGLLGVVQLRNVAVGNAELMRHAGVDARSLECEAQRLRVLGQTVIFVGFDGVAVGLLGVADPLKPEAWDAVQQLKTAGLQVVLMSGDHADTVRAIAAQLGIEQVVADVPPEDRAARVAGLRSAGAVVAMVGNGATDAPALAAADVGVVVGSSSDAGEPAAHVSVQGGDLLGVVRALRLSEATLRNAGQNLMFGLGYSLVAGALAAGALHAVAGWSLPPTLAAVATALSCGVVLVNSRRLRTVRI